MWAAFVRFVHEVCAVPPAPAGISGSAAGVQVFRAAPGWYRYRLLVFGLRQLPLLLGLGGGFLAIELAAGEAAASGDTGEVVAWILRAIEAVSATGWVIGLATGYAVQRLDYEMRWYILTDRSLRIREGVLVVKELTLTFANVQNVTVSQGPLQRWFGVADVRVQTAGGGAARPGQPEPLHTGVLRGIEDAEALRELVLRRVRSHEDAGLGDPDDGARTVEAARVAGCAALVSEARALADAAETLTATGAAVMR